MMTNHRTNIWQKAFATNCAAAIWRLPKCVNKQLIVNINGLSTETEIEISALSSGFLFAPFVEKEAILISADNYYVFGQNEQTIQVKELNKNFLNTQNQLPYQTEQIAKKKIIENTKQDFINATKQAIEAIELGVFKKVVLSRTKEILLDEDFDLMDTFDKLCEKYPNAFVSMVFIPHLEQIWVGASPEILVSQNKEGIFRTMALAGTQSAIESNGQYMKPAHATWTQKEIEEQAYVSRYIIDCFKKIRLRDFEEEGPKTIVAGNLLHLQTDFIVDTEIVDAEGLISTMLELLHPTSAVCGMPKQAALDFILKHESHEREFYSGFLGPINIEDESNLFVNLRTMKIENGIATLFAGCGITADSIPEKEWLETEMKCQTLESVLMR